jgi:EmrB/QacA subfamily drug resistance transporter
VVEVAEQVEPASSRGLDPALRALATVVVLGSIMSILDTTIVAVALDTLGRDFKVSVSTIQWVTTGYLLSLAMVIPVTGWAMDRFGAKRMWMISLVLFVGGSTLCGLSWSATSLIFFRVLQGLGGGMILPIGQSVLARAAGPQRMGRVMSIVGVPMVMGPVLGPVLGGIIVSNFSWRWIFYVNVPIGIVALALSARTLTNDRSITTTKFDALGFVLLSPGLVSLVYALAEVGTTGSFRSDQVLVSFGLGVVLLAAFGWHARRAAQPLLDLRLFRYRSFTLANCWTFLFGATLFGSMFLLPLYYQIARGQSAAIAGLLMAPQGVGAAVIMRTAGAITDRLGVRKIVPAGVVLMILGTVPFPFVTATTSEPLLALALFVRGLGLGMTMMPIMASAYQELESSVVPNGTTLINIVRQIGASIATALFAVILQRQIEDSLHGGGGLSLASTAKLPPSVARLVAQSFAHTFWWALGTVTLLIIPTMFLPKTVSRPPAARGSAPPAGVIE